MLHIHAIICQFLRQKYSLTGYEEDSAYRGTQSTCPVLKCKRLSALWAGETFAEKFTFGKVLFFHEVYLHVCVCIYCVLIVESVKGHIFTLYWWWTLQNEQGLACSRDTVNIVYLVSQSIWAEITNTIAWVAYQKYIPHGSGGWKSKISVPPQYMTSSQWQRVEREKASSLVSFYTGTNPIREDSTLIT